MNSFRAYWDLVRWDWVREMKKKETIVSMVLFALVTLVIFSIAAGGQPFTSVQEVGEPGITTLKIQVVERIGSGILWVTFFLAGAIGVDRAFGKSGDERVFEGLLLAPMSRATIYYARVTSTLIFVSTMQAVAFVAFCFMYSVELELLNVFRIALGTLAATLGFVAAGVTLSAMTRSIRGGEVLLRLLLFPLVLPLFYSVVSLTHLVFNTPRIRALGLPSELGFTEVAILVAFDLVYVAAGQILFEVVVSDFDG